MKNTKATKPSINAKPAATSTQACYECVYITMYCEHHRKELKTAKFGCCRFRETKR
jgi:hypothetical protein